MRAHRNDDLDPMQRMALKERETERHLKMVVVYASIAFAFLALVVAPWVAATTGVAAFGYLRLRAD
jgi:hypothetical protein